MDKLLNEKQIIAAKSKNSFNTRNRSMFNNTLAPIIHSDQSFRDGIPQVLAMRPAGQVEVYDANSRDAAMKLSNKSLAKTSVNAPMPVTIINKRVMKNPILDKEHYQQHNKTIAERLA